MSDLQKKWAKAKMSNALHAMASPPVPEFSEFDEDRYGSSSVPNTPQDDDSSSASSVSSTGTVIPSPGRALFARPQGFPGRSLDPIPWTTYFERELFLPAEDGSITYHAYLTSPAPSPGPGKPPGPLFVTHHGAGSSGLSFAVLSSEIRKRLPSAGILSLDARGHGLTTATTTTGTTIPTPPSFSSTSTSLTANGVEGVPEREREDLTLATLASDLLSVITLTKTAMHWPSLPPIILVGHSLGGAVVTELAYSLAATTTTSSSNNSKNNKPAQRTGSVQGPLPGSGQLRGPDLDLLGYAVLDVVEGSAMDALQSMHAYLATRPAGFDSLRDAVEWHVRSRTVRNAVSARASVPGLLVHSSSSSSSSHSQSQSHSSGGGGEAHDGGVKDGGDIEEEKEKMKKKNGEGFLVPGMNGGTRGKERSNSKPWRWRTDLAKTQPFWEGWFGGLSKKFLSGRGGKMLLLAGTDRLDTELTIGQMQGKYALQVFPEAGHFIHEDLPEKTAIALVDFHRRNDRSALVLPPKVSELLAQGKRV
ncbi:Alpha/Beta hydrolase protein [Chaetomium strumarium]|uniref:Protein phosphatase methylesterase 1 n=1 Tax=Chaetomium strumarium TaxID=1170767 RepID=A0AAJ0M5Q3_9PEZI|nr:Alpha/Beta hydrolase protein [Chaetomium strumarium]